MGSDYVSVVQRTLGALVPADLVGWVTVDVPSARATTAGVDEVAEVERIIWDVLFEHPMIVSYMSERLASYAPRRISDIIPMRRFRMTRTYAELFAPFHARYSATVVTSGRPPGLACWTLNRWDRDFADCELDLLTRLQEPLSLLELASVAELADPDAEAGEARLRAGLTGREAQVLELVAGGLTAVAIGHRLRVSPRTVRKHLENAYAKLGCHDRMVAVSRARQMGIIPP